MEISVLVFENLYNANDALRCGLVFLVVKKDLSSVIINIPVVSFPRSAILVDSVLLGCLRNNWKNSVISNNFTYSALFQLMFLFVVFTDIQG